MISEKGLNILQNALQGSSLSKSQQKNLLKYAKTHGTVPSMQPEPKKQGPKKTIKPTGSKRSLKQILDSCDYEIKYEPGPLPPSRESKIEKLQNLMYPEIFTERVLEVLDEATELKNEIKERKEWIEEMEKLGGHDSIPQIKKEIQEREIQLKSLK